MCFRYERNRYLCKLCDNTELLWAFKGIKHFNDIFMLQLP